MPSMYVIFPSRDEKYTKMVLPRRIGRSMLSMSLSTIIFFETIAVTPIISKMFAMFDPTTSPTTMVDSPLRTAIIEVIISGIEVPSATIVTPIINDGILKCIPILSAVDVNLSADRSRAVSAAANIAIH